MGFQCGSSTSAPRHLDEIFITSSPPEEAVKNITCAPVLQRLLLRRRSERVVVEMRKELWSLGGDASPGGEEVRALPVMKSRSSRGRYGLNSQTTPPPFTKSLCTRSFSGSFNCKISKDRDSTTSRHLFVRSTSHSSTGAVREGRCPALPEAQRHQTSLLPGLQLREEQYHSNRSLWVHLNSLGEPTL